MLRQNEKQLWFSVSPCFLMVTELFALNHRMAWVGRNLNDHSVSISLHGQGAHSGGLDQVAQGPANLYLTWNIFKLSQETICSITVMKLHNNNNNNAWPCFCF